MLERLVRELDDSVSGGNVEHITGRVKASLEHFSRESLHLPAELLECTAGSYARRLIHRDPAGSYTVVAMTWGPGQGTELHDHAGIWCVECVVHGELRVEQYDLVERHDERFRFEARRVVQAGVGRAGCLIPPFEYHKLANGRADGPTVTIHVYGGEMDFCHLYRPVGSGWWAREPKRLEYASS